MSEQNTISAVTANNGSTYVLIDAGLRSQAGVLSGNGVEVSGVNENYFRPTVKVFDAQPVRTDLSVIKLSADDYDQLVVDGNVLSNALYIVEDDHEDLYGEQIKNLAPGTQLSDAVNYEQLLSGLNAKQDAGNYLSSNALDNYYTKSQTSSTTELNTAFSNKQSKITANGILSCDGAGNVASAEISLDGYATEQWVNEHKSAVSVDGELSDTNVVHVSNTEYEQGVINNTLSANWIYVVSSDYEDMYGQQVKNVAPATDLSDAVNYEQMLSGLSTKQNKITANGILSCDGNGNVVSTEISLDGYATEQWVDENKSAVSVDTVKSDVNIQHISREDYAQLVVNDAVLSNTLYILSSSYIEAYGKQVKNLGTATDLSDAVNLGQLSIALDGKVPVSRLVAGHALSADVTVAQLSAALGLSCKAETSDIPIVDAALSTQGAAADAKAVGDALRYSLVQPDPFVFNTLMAVVVQDRAVNLIQVQTGVESLAVTIPAGPAGKSRDFFLRIEVPTGVTDLHLSIGAGAVTPVIETSDGDLPTIEENSTTIMYFAETKTNTFLVKSDAVTVVS